MLPKTKTPTRPEPPAGPQLLDLEVASLVGHPRNVRRTISDIGELAASIAERGVLEPLVVAPAADGDTYVVIAGHRRLAAAQQACVLTVPCIVRHDITDDVDIITAMLAENLMRSDLSAVEEAEAYEQLEMAGLSSAEIAQRTGRSKGTVTSRLALMKLPETTRDRVHGHQLTLEEASALLEFADDPQLVAKLEAFAGSPNWRWEVNGARHAREVAARAAAATDALTATGVPVVSTRDLDAGGWHHRLSRVLDDSTIPGITDESTDADLDEARRAAHADCPHHAAYLRDGAPTYICLKPAVHAPPGETSDDEDDNEDDEAARAARDADRAALAAQHAQEDADVRTAASIRQGFVADVCAGRTHTLTPEARDAIALAVAQLAAEFAIETSALDLAPFLGVDISDRPAGSNYRDEQVWMEALEGRVQAAMARRDGPKALLAVLAAFSEEGLQARWQWAFDANALKTGSSERRYLAVLRTAGYELTDWEIARLAAADAHAAATADDDQ